MKRIRIIAIAVLILSAAIWALSCNFIQDVELMGVKKAEVKRVTSKFVELDLWLHIDNPNSFKIEITETDLDAYFDTLKIGKAALMEPFEIPAKANGEFHCPIHAEFDKSFAGKLGAFVKIALSGPISIRIKGDIIGKALLMTRKMEIDLEEKIDF